MNRILILTFITAIFTPSYVLASYDQYEGKTRPSVSANKLNLQDERQLRDLRRQLAIEEKKNQAMFSAAMGLSKTLLQKDKFDRESQQYLGNKKIAGLAALIDKAFDNRWIIYKNMYTNLNEERPGALAVPYKAQLQANQAALLSYIAQYREEVSKEKNAAVQSLVTQLELESEVNDIIDEFVDLGATCNEQGGAQAGWCRTQ